MTLLLLTLPSTPSTPPVEHLGVGLIPTHTPSQGMNLNPDAGRVLDQVPPGQNLTTGQVTYVPSQGVLLTPDSGRTLGQTTPGSVFDDDLRFVDTSLGPVTVTLPVPVFGQDPIVIVKVGADSNAITVNAAGGALINGAASVQLSTSYAGATFVTDGHNYYERR